MSKTEQSTPLGNSVYEIIHVRFADLPKTYNYNRNQLNVRNGEVVVAETDRGDGVGTVVIDAVEPCCNAPLDSLKRVLRKATEKDIERERERKELERRAYQLCVEKASGFKLDMNLVTVQYFFDRSKAIFYFTADGRIDFRELVKLGIDKRALLWYHIGEGLTDREIGKWLQQHNGTGSIKNFSYWQKPLG